MRFLRESGSWTDGNESYGLIRQLFVCLLFIKQRHTHSHSFHSSIYLSTSCANGAILPQSTFNSISSMSRLKQLDSSPIDQKERIFSSSFTRKYVPSVTEHSIVLLRFDIIVYSIHSFISYIVCLHLQSQLTTILLNMLFLSIVFIYIHSYHS